MKKFLFVLLAYSGMAHAINTDSYVQIREVKAWDSQIDVYLVDNQEHQCAGDNKTRFLIDVTEAHKVSFIITAFSAGKSVSLAYNCNSEGYPVISGIWMR